MTYPFDNREVQLGSVWTPKPAEPDIAASSPETVYTEPVTVTHMFLDDENSIFVSFSSVPSSWPRARHSMGLHAFRKRFERKDMADWERGVEEQADRITRADYWRDVRHVAEWLFEAIKSKDVEDEEAAQEWLDQTVDGHSRVIYTAQAKECLLYSENDGAYLDEFGPDGVVEDGCLMWSRLAYSAFMADIRDHLDWDTVTEALEDQEAGVEA